VDKISTECVMDLDWQSEMIILKSILTFKKKQVSFLEAAGAVVWIGLSLKSNHHLQNEFSKEKNETNAKLTRYSQTRL